MEDNKKSVLHDFAEEKVANDLEKNKALLHQRFILAHNINEMGQQLSKKGWARVWSGVTSGVTGKKPVFQDKVEEETSKQVRKLIGLEAMLVIADDRLLKAALEEIKKMREIFAEKEAAANLAEENKEGNE